jgi:hypothetical protein
MSTLLEYSSQAYRRSKGNFRFRVDADGGLFVQQNRIDVLDHHGWAEDWPAAPQAKLDDAEAKLQALLEQNGFFALDESYASGQRRDGALQLLAWHGPRARTVKVDRDQVPAFETLVGHLIRELGIEKLL